MNSVAQCFPGDVPASRTALRGFQFARRCFYKSPTSLLHFVGNQRKQQRRCSIQYLPVQAAFLRHLFAGFFDRPRGGRGHVLHRECFGPKQPSTTGQFIRQLVMRIQSDTRLLGFFRWIKRENRARIAKRKRRGLCLCRAKKKASCKS